MSSRLWLTVILVVYLVLAVVYNVSTPPFEAPDEYWHYHFVRDVAVGHGLPVVNPDGSQPFRHEGLQAPLYYIAAAPMIGWLDADAMLQTAPKNPFVRIGEPALGSRDNRNAVIHSPAEDFPYQGSTLALHLTRLFSTLLGAGTLILTYLLARELFPSSSHSRFQALPLLATAFVAFLPQFLYVSSTVSNDSGMIFISSLMLWQFIRLGRLPLTPRRAIALGVTLGLALLTKLSALVWVPFTVIALGFLAWRTREYRRIVAMGAVILALGALLGVWWFVRNRMLYGAFLTSDMIAQMVGTRPTFLGLDRWLRDEAQGVWLSTWGVFGWFNILAPEPYYRFYDVMALFGAAGIAVVLVSTQLRKTLSPMLALLPVWIAAVILALWYFSASVISNQGRLLFPALPSYAVLWAMGMLALIPPAWNRVVGLALGILFAGIAAVVPFVLIAPAFQPMAVSGNVLPQGVTTQTWQFQNGMTWQGAELDQSKLRPGENLTVTLYSRAAAPTPPNQALFIHVLNESDAIMAQRDSLPGQGNPSAMLPGRLYAEPYTVTVPLTVPVTGTWRVVAGMYDRNTGARIPLVNGGDEVGLGTVQPQAPADWGFDFGGAVKLNGVDFSQTAVAPGKTLSLVFHWGDVTAAQKYRVFVHALGKDDHQWAAADGDIVPGEPTRIMLHFATDTPPDSYPLEMGVYPAPDGDRLEVFDAQGVDLNDRLFLGPVKVTGGE